MPLRLLDDDSTETTLLALAEGRHVVIGECAYAGWLLAAALPLFHFIQPDGGAIFVRTTAHHNATRRHHVPTDATRRADFWTTRCERCPEALTKLNKFAEGWDQEALPTLFLSICCGNGTADDEEVGRDLAEEGEWYEMTHAYVATETKEMCKETFGFKSVPHYVVASKDGQVRPRLPPPPPPPPP